MLVNLYKVVLPVSDLDRAETFYQQLLNVPGRRGSPELCHFDVGETILTCYLASREQDADEPAASREMCFYVDDLETIFLQAQQAGCASLDEEIINQPWGYLSFTAEDPFGNYFVFVDGASMRRQMDERLTAGPDDLLQSGVALSVESLEEDSQHQPMAGSVAKIFKDEIWIRFADSSPDAHYGDDEPVRIRFWIGEEVFLSETTVLKAPSNTGHVAISIPHEARMLQRRAVPRVLLPIPVSFSVFTSPDSEEIEEESFQTESQDVSTVGIRLETEASLKEGDKVWLRLRLSSSEAIRVIANVTRTEQIDAERILAGLQFVEIPLEDQMKLLKLLIQDVVEEPSQAAPKEQETATPVNQQEDGPAPVQVDEETSVQMEVVEEVQAPIQQQEEPPTPVEVSEETSAPLDSDQEVSTETAEDSPTVQDPENEQEEPAPVALQEESPAALDETQEVGAAQEEAATAPLEIQEEPPAVLDETQEVGTAREEEAAPAPLEIQEEPPAVLDETQEVGAAQAEEAAPAPLEIQEAPPLRWMRPRRSLEPPLYRFKSRKWLLPTKKKSLFCLLS